MSDCDRCEKQCPDCHFKQKLNINWVSCSDRLPPRGKMEWIKFSEKQPPLRTDVLVMAKTGYNFKFDESALEMFLGFFYNCNEGSKRLKPDIIFEVDCRCSGSELDRENFKVIYWMPLPEPPRENGMD